MRIAAAWPVALAALGLLGCAGKSPPEGHRSPGKPRPPVVLRLAQVPELQPGVPARVRLELTLPEGARIHSIEFDDAPALQVTAVTVGAGGRLEAAVLPMDDGPRALGGIVTFQLDGMLQAAPFRLPLPVAGDPPPVAASIPAPAGVLRQDVRGGMVMSLAAETTTR